MPDKTGSQPAGSVAYSEYISDMLAELAELAAANGDRRLAMNLRLVALEAARGEAVPEDA